MKAGIAGGSSQQRSKKFNDERSVNCFPVVDQRGRGQVAMYARPGNNLITTAGTGPCRGAFTASNGRCFFVSANALYELNLDMSVTLRGNLNQSNFAVTMDENRLQLAVCDGNSLYILVYSTNAFQRVTSVNLPSAATVTFLGGYFIVNQSFSSGIFRISALYDGLTWAALDFATAESSPDNLLCVKNVAGQLVLVGTNSTEFYSNTGGVKFPFSRVNGATITTGTISAFSVLTLDNSLFLVGRDQNGIGIVYRLRGFTPQRISTEAIELRLQAATSPQTFRSWSYQEDGHTFFILTGGGMETTLCYDLATETWSERAYLNQAGNYEQELAATGTFAFGKTITFDRSNGNIYQQSLKFNSDAGREIAVDRIFTHLQDENQRIVFANLTVGFETGVGTQTGQGADPKAILYTSKDGGYTWSGGREKPLGKVGQYSSRVTWHRLGQARQMTFRVRVTDPVNRYMSGAWVNV